MEASNCCRCRVQPVKWLANGCVHGYCEPCIHIIQQAIKKDSQPHQCSVSQCLVVLQHIWTTYNTAERHQLTMTVKGVKDRLRKRQWTEKVKRQQQEKERLQRQEQQREQQQRVRKQQQQRQKQMFRKEVQQLRRIIQMERNNTQQAMMTQNSLKIKVEQYHNQIRKQQKSKIKHKLRSQLYQQYYLSQLLRHTSFVRIIIVKEQKQETNHVIINKNERSIKFHDNQQYIVDQIVQQKNEIGNRLLEIIQLSLNVQKNKRILISFFGQSNSGKTTACNSLMHTLFQDAFNNHQSIYLQGLEFYKQNKVFTFLKHGKTELKSKIDQNYVPSQQIKNITQYERYVNNVSINRIIRNNKININSSRSQIAFIIKIQNIVIYIIDMAGKQDPLPNQQSSSILFQQTQFINSTNSQLSQIYQFHSSQKIAPAAHNNFTNFIIKIIKQSTILNIGTISSQFIAKSQNTVRMISLLKELTLDQKKAHNEDNKKKEEDEQQLKNNQPKKQMYFSQQKPLLHAIKNMPKYPKQ